MTSTPITVRKQQACHSYFRDFLVGVCDNKEQKQTLIDDLTLLKSDLEMIIASTKK